jgi:hypothetical protein
VLVAEVKHDDATRCRVFDDHYTVKLANGTTMIASKTVALPGEGLEG